jgi:putative SOS response-associated peptidase YedK
MSGAPIIRAFRRGQKQSVTIGADASQLKFLLAPLPAEEMTCWRVSGCVGNVKNNDPSLIEPIAAQGG